MADRELDKLMAASAGGDDDAYAVVAEAMSDRLYRLALAQGLPADDAADAAQEALVRGFQRRARYRPSGRADAWLMGIAMNVIREWWRSRRRTRPAGLELLADLPAATPDANAQENEDHLAALQRALAALPGRQREALACRYLRRLSVRMTAEVMGCAEGTVKAATAAGIANLRKRLEPTA